MKHLTPVAAVLAAFAAAGCGSGADAPDRTARAASGAETRPRIDAPEPRPCPLKDADGVVTRLRQAGTNCVAARYVAGKTLLDGYLQSGVDRFSVSLRNGTVDCRARWQHTAAAWDVTCSGTRYKDGPKGPITVTFRVPQT